MDQQTEQPWLTKAEAAAALRVSERTIDSWIAERRLGVRKQQIPGRKPATMVDPDDVARVFAEQNKGAILPANGQNAMQAAPRGELAVIEQLARLFVVPQPQKIYLTLEQAAEHTSLPLPLLRRFIDEGRLPSAHFRMDVPVPEGEKRKRVRQTWVRRDDVEHIEFSTHVEEAQ